MNFVFRALSVKMFQASLFGIRTEEFSRKQATDSLNRANKALPGRETESDLALA